MIENLDEIKKQANVGHILKFLRATNINGSSGEIRADCPIVTHAKSIKSFSINSISGEWSCHACDEGGDIIELVVRAENKSFKDAAIYVAEISGIEVEFAGATKTTIPKVISSPKQFERSTVLQKTKLTQQQVHQELDKASPVGDHQYLKEKCVVACPDLRFGKDQMGNDSIVVPFYDADKGLQTIQYVHGSGKYFLKDAPTVGSFFTIGEFQADDEVYLAEGLATALTIWMALDKKVTVISFGSAGNMVSVVSALKSKYPNLKLVICLDSSDAAYKQVVKINPAYNCSYRSPSFEGLTSQDTSKKLSDFNDIVSKCGQPISVVREQLMIEKTIDDLPITKKELTAEVAPQADEKLSSFSDEYQEELLGGYLFRKSYDDVLADSFSPEHFQPSCFTGLYSLVMKGIIKSWELFLPITIAQIALNAGNDSSIFYDLLKKLEIRSAINPTQVKERLNRLSDDLAKRKLNNIITEVQNSDAPLHIKADLIRHKVDNLQGDSEVVLSQSHYLAAHCSEINNTQNKPLSTGFKTFDRLIGGGFKKGELGVLAGGAGVGKSAFALQVADNVASDGNCVIYVSVEIGTRKLTERSLKRLSMPFKLDETNIQGAIQKYSKYSDNLFMIKGYHGMTVSEIRGKVLSVKRSNKKDILLIIDPFQRLGTGNDSLDWGNETVKVGQVIAGIKEMAEDLSIPILALSDTVKNHHDNQTGEGASRSSYMIDHTADYNIMLRTSRNPLSALYGTTKTGATKSPNLPSPEDDPFVDIIKKKVEATSYKPEIKLPAKWDKYAALVTSKVRDSGRFSPLFVYKPAFHLFEETSLWDDIFKENNE